MTPEQIKAEADRIVEMYIYIELPRNCNYSLIGNEAATHCAILYVQGQIEEMSLIDEKVGSINIGYYDEDRIEHYNLLLTELKSRV